MDAIYGPAGGALLPRRRGARRSHDRRVTLARGLLGSARSLLALTCLLITATATAAVIEVHPDGSGDYPTIQAALDAALDGDVVELSDGVYIGEGNRDLAYGGKSLTMRSAGGNPASCVIDCQGSLAEPHRALRLVSGLPTGWTMEGIGIRRGFANYGGAVYVDDYVEGTLRRCEFAGNAASSTGGVLSCDCALSAFLFEDCRFVGNTAEGVGVLNCGGGSPSLVRCEFIENRAASVSVLAAHWSGVQFSDCRFVRNATWGPYSAAVYVDGSPEFVRCEFVENTNSGTGALCAWSSSEALFEQCLFAGNILNGPVLECMGYHGNEVTQCTFFANHIPAGDAVIAVHDHSFTVAQTIVAGTLGGSAVSGSGALVIECCDFYGNEGGDWTPEVESFLGTAGNIREDPQFCSPHPLEDGNYGLQADSPCAADNSGCGTMGCEGVACGETAAQPTSWGRLKELFLR